MPACGHGARPAGFDPGLRGFCRTFAGIGKASAARLSDGQPPDSPWTIAGADDAAKEELGHIANLVKALRDLGDPYLPIQVDVHELLALVISASAAFCLTLATCGNRSNRRLSQPCSMSLVSSGASWDRRFF
jgi:hypothetical protein